MVHQNKEENQRKEYRTPKLMAYGNLADLTRNVAQTGALDGGFAPPLELHTR